MDKKQFRLVFMGTPQISAKVFNDLINEGYHFVALISQPDKAVGRKGVVMNSPTKEVALKNNIPVYQPKRIRKDFSFLYDLSPDLIITFAYGQIVPKEVLDIPKFGCVNLHGSLLPDLRGASPVQYALAKNYKKTGVTLMEMIEEMDAGKMFAKEEVDIEEMDNSTSLFEKISIAASKLIIDSLPRYLNGELKGIEQDENKVTFAPIIKPEMEKLSLEQGVFDFLGWIKALSDTPGGYLYFEGKKLKIFKAHIVSNQKLGKLGEIIKSDKQGLHLQLTDGVIALDVVQEEGKKKMDYKSFINGKPLFIGTILS